MGLFLCCVFWGCCLVCDWLICVAIWYCLGIVRLFAWCGVVRPLLIWFGLMLWLVLCLFGLIATVCYQ